MLIRYDLRSALYFAEVIIWSRNKRLLLNLPSMNLIFIAKLTFSPLVPFGLNPARLWSLTSCTQVKAYTSDGKSVTG